MDALPLATRLTFALLTCRRKQRLVCCRKLVEISRSKEIYERKIHLVLRCAIRPPAVAHGKEKTDASFVVTTIYSLLLWRLCDRQQLPPTLSRR